MVASHAALGLSSRMRNSSQRSANAQAMAALIVFIAGFIILPLGLFGVELARHILLRQQLQSVCDAAALAGAATLVSSTQGLQDTGPAAIVQAQKDAMKVALEFVKRNNIGGQSLEDVEGTFNQGDRQHDPAIHKAIVDISLVNDKNGRMAVGQPASGLALNAYYGDRPLFAGILGITKAVVTARATAGVRPIDMMICFDISDSIDDLTPVTFVKRYWDGNKVRYDIPQSNGKKAQGGIFQILRSNIFGSGVNAMPPYNLHCAARSYNDYPFMFSELDKSSVKGLRANLNFGAITSGNELGCPPGNFDENDRSEVKGHGINPYSDSTAFTDVVTNLDGNDVFRGWNTPDGKYTFPNVATLVEAARGNLDLDAGQFKKSQGDTDANISSDLLPQPKAGYQAAYMKRAEVVRSPLYEAKQAAISLIKSLEATSDARIGLVTFNGNVGSDATSTFTERTVDGVYKPGGKTTVPLPLVKLGQVAGPATNNYDSVIGAITPLTARGGTDLATAVKHAREELATNRHRDNAVPVIVMFTDGIPNPFGGLDGEGPRKTYEQAEKCKDAGIPIFSIGLALNDSLVPLQNDILGDEYTDPQPAPGHGISRISGGRYISVTNVDDLRAAFQSIQRSLVVLK